jgi:hypothetical protein
MPGHEMSNQVAEHQTPPAHERLPEQVMLHVLSKPPQLMRPLHELVPEHSIVVSFAPAAGPAGHDPAPLQEMVHLSPSQFAPFLQLFAPEHAILVLGASLETLTPQESEPAHSTLQLSPAQAM